MSNNEASASPAPSAIGLWVKVIVAVVMVIAGYAYIWSLVHPESGQTVMASGKSEGMVSVPAVAPYSAQTLAREQIPTRQARPEVPATVSFGPGDPTESRVASRPTAAGVGAAAPDTIQAPESGAVTESQAIVEEASAVEAASAGVVPDTQVSTVPQATTATAPDALASASAEADAPRAAAAIEPEAESSAAATVAVAAQPIADGALAVETRAVNAPSSAEQSLVAEAPAAADVQPAAEASRSSAASATGAAAAPSEGFRAHQYRPRVPDVMRELSRLQAEAMAERAGGPRGYGPGYGYPGLYPGASGGRRYGPGYYGYPYGPQRSVPAAGLPARAPQ